MVSRFFAVLLEEKRRKARDRESIQGIDRSN
jgi:hypothetical protein